MLVPEPSLKNYWYAMILFGYVHTGDLVHVQSLDSYSRIPKLTNVIKRCLSD